MKPRIAYVGIALSLFTIVGATLLSASSLLWTYPGDPTDVAKWQIVVDGATTTVIPSKTGDDYKVALPELKPGRHTVQVVACSDWACTPSDPTSGAVPSKPANIRIEVTFEVPLSK